MRFSIQHSGSVRPVMLRSTKKGLHLSSKFVPSKYSAKKIGVEMAKSKRRRNTSSMLGL